MWVAAVAAMLGVLVAAATGSSAPPWWLLGLLIALPGALTVGERLRRKHRFTVVASPYWEGSSEVAPIADNERRASQPSALEGEERSAPKEIAPDDWDVVSEICRALSPRQIDWFRLNDFATPWLDVHARPVLEIEPLVIELVERPFEPDIRSAVGGLADTVHAFVGYYRHNALPDPLVLGEDWRFFQWDDHVVATEKGKVADTWAGRAAHLQHLANSVAVAYERFSVTALRNPNVRQRIASRGRSAANRRGRRRRDSNPRWRSSPP